MRVHVARHPWLLATLLLAGMVVPLLAAGLGGTIESIPDGGTSLVLKVAKEDKSYTLEVDEATKITLNGKPATLGDLEPGQRAFVTTADDRATKISARTDQADSSEDAAPRKEMSRPRKEPPAPRKPPVRPSVGSTSAGTKTPGTAPWPQFRGPNHDNLSKETGLLKSWPEGGPRLVWATPGLGEGYSSVSVADGKVLTMGNQGSREAILALDAATGKPLWAVPSGPAFVESMGNGPRSVPTIDNGLAYALGASGDLSCVELDSGKARWQMNILQQFGGNVPKWGICESVLIDGDRLICTPGGQAGTMVALNKQNGRLIWSSMSPGGDQAAYVSPIVADVGGVRQYIQITSRGTLGVRAADGRCMWQDSGGANDTANCSAPVYSDGFVFSASDYGAGGALVHLTSANGATTATPVYQTRKMKSHHGGMVLVDGFLYGCDDQILTCLEFKTGNVMWFNRSVGKGSLTYADGHLYVRSEQGPVALVAASPEGYRETGRFEPPQRGERPAWAYPVIAEGKLYLRDGDLLFCYDVKDSTSSTLPR
jgi:outer membrane protein assembly factor BamB